MSQCVTRLLVCSLLMLAGGCPDQTAPTIPDDLTASAVGPNNAGVGETVVLSAQVGADVDASVLSYQWYQTFGRTVDIADTGSAELHFAAPSVGVAQTLEFRVVIAATNGTTDTAEVTVRIAADPDYGVDPTTDPNDVGELFPQVRMVIRDYGTVTIELNRQKAPLTVNNFLRYVDDGFYNETVLHRVIDEFVVQGGGFDLDFEQKETRSPIINESDNGLNNDRTTIAMARTADPDSATSQFYINLIDNDSLNASDGANGYAVFGKVVDGMDIIDEIGVVETESRDGRQDVPVDDVIVDSITRV